MSIIKLSTLSVLLFAICMLSLYLLSVYTKVDINEIEVVGATSIALASVITLFFIIYNW